MSGIAVISTEVILRSCKKISRRYSPQDVENALVDVNKWLYEWDYSKTSDLEEAWDVFLVLTSDESWGCGRMHLVDKKLKMAVEGFMRDLLRWSEPNEWRHHGHSVVNFIIENIESVNQSTFVRMLRGALLAYPKSYNHFASSGSIHQNNFTALQLAADCEHIPQVVMKTLLEGGVDVHFANDNGDTALMLAIFRQYGGVGCKAEVLLDYGADIGVYNISFQTCIHLAVIGENVEGLRLVLSVREERLRQWEESMQEEEGSMAIKKYEHGTRGETPISTTTKTKELAAETKQVSLRCRDVLTPDPLHMKDDEHHTPLVALAFLQSTNYKVREEMLQMLLGAGSNADVDVGKEARYQVAQRKSDALGEGGETIPPAFGLINCQPGGDYMVFVTVRKDDYVFDILVALDIITLFVDKDISILPPESLLYFDLESFFMQATNKRFECDGTLGGLDFDLHFNITDKWGFDTNIIPDVEKAEYKMCLRFPKGPCPVRFWTMDVEPLPMFKSRISMDMGYTLAHHAVLCRGENLRRKMIVMARSLCNPLMKCSDGKTAVDLLEVIVRRSSTGTSSNWELRRFLRDMKKSHDAMLTYVFPDALLLQTDATGTKQEQCAAIQKRTASELSLQNSVAKKPRSAAKQGAKKSSSTSLFAPLPDEVCKHILSFL